MSRPCVLILSESPFHLMLMGDLLEANDVRTVRATTAAEGLSLLQEVLPAVVVLDLDLRGSERHRFLESCRGSSDFAGVPVLLVAAEDQLVEADVILSCARGQTVTKPIDTGRFPRAVLREIRKPTSAGARSALL